MVPVIRCVVPQTLRCAFDTVCSCRRNFMIYLDLIETALGAAARKAFAMLPETYQFTGPSYLRGKAEGEACGDVRGEARGKAEGEANAVLAVLEARGLVPTDQQRQRVLACADLEQLNTWVRKAVTLVDVEELFTQ